MRKTAWIWLLITITWLLAGCRPQGNAPSRDPLAGSNWRLVSITSHRTLAPTDNLSLQFDNQGFGRGSTGCNEFSGSYQAGEGKLRFGPLTVTERACLEPSRMELEAAYLQALSQVESYGLVDGEQRLILSSSDGSQLLKFIRQ